jgi:putative transposase
VVAWEVAKRKDQANAADQVSRAWLHGRISKGRKQPLILHADNGNAMRAATLEARLEMLGVMRSFTRPRVSIVNPDSKSLYRRVKYRPDNPSRPFASAQDSCLSVASIVDWYDHRYHHSGMRFATPHQRLSGQAVEICNHRSLVYEQARQRHPRRWSRSICCWNQQEVVWIKPPPSEIESKSITLAMAA